MVEPMLQVENLAVGYAAEPVAVELNLRVDAGEMVSILGASGVGKSSLLRAVAGFLTPHTGVIRVAGEDVAGWAPERRQVGMVFQSGALFGHMSVRDNVGFGLIGQANAAETVAELLDNLGLAALAERLPAQLSGGQRQRVGIARALAPSPRLLLLDEPFASLDTDLRRSLGSWCKETLSARGTAALLVTHDRVEAMALSDRVALMGAEEGGVARFLQVGTPAAIYNAPTSVQAARLSGEMLLIDGQIVRPEQVEITADATGCARILWCRYAGGHYHVQIEFEGLEMRLNCDRAWAPGPVALRVAARNLELG
jgi:ABC-type Fe3+/spermidine/putrescine transport system ATPase subunit